VTPNYSFLVLLILTLFIGVVQSITSCNSFPKIFGGTFGDTFIYQIDVYNDYLAFGGDTYDYSLIGSPYPLPYLTLTSISKGSKYYWAKALSLK
jgi:hypothetical protein